MNSFHHRWRRMLAGTCAAVVLGTLPACAGDDTTSSAPQVASAVVRDLSTYEAFMLASAENNLLFADVYGVRFDPLVVDRITTMKRISSLGADGEQVLVAAADRDVDRLAVVNGDGTLSPVPGLGRPYAFLNKVYDGVLYYQTVKGDTEINREFSYDLAARTKKLLFESAERSGVYPLIGGGFTYGRETPESGADSLVDVEDKSGKVRTLSYKAEIYGGIDGERWSAGTINAPDAGFGDKPETLVLLDLKSGKTKRVDGLQAVCWTPDGTRLLARRVGDPLSSPLVLLDPDKPSDIVEVGTVPGLAIFGGVWVRNNP
ncbi:MAG: hypothetical protein ACT4P1_07585 [Sporichthyaceae bacterium]